MIECVRKYKNLNKNFKLTKCLLKSKNIYESFRAEYEDRPNYIKNNLKIDWENVYKKLFTKDLVSDLIVINFKVLNNALSLNIKYNNRFKNACFLCRKNAEDLDHLFIKCSVTNKIFNHIKSLYFRGNKILNKYDIYFSKSLNQKETKLFSIFKLCLWKLRNFTRMQRQNNFNSLMKFFLYNFENYI